MGQVYGIKKWPKLPPEPLFLLYDFRNCTSYDQNAISENILKRMHFEKSLFKTFELQTFKEFQTFMRYIENITCSVGNFVTYILVHAGIHCSSERGLILCQCPQM